MKLQKLKRSSFNIVLAAGLLAAFACNQIMPAFAETAAALPANQHWYDGFLPLLNAVIDTLLTVFIGWAATNFQRRTGLDIDAGHRDALHSAAMTGISLALSRLGGAGADKTTVTNTAIDYMQTAVPDAMKHFFSDNSTPNLLNNFVDAKYFDAVSQATPVVDALSLLRQPETSARNTARATQLVTDLIKQKSGAATVSPDDTLDQYNYSGIELETFGELINDQHWPGVQLSLKQIDSCEGKTVKSLISLVASMLK